MISINDSYLYVIVMNGYKQDLWKGFVFHDYDYDYDYDYDAL